MSKKKKDQGQKRSALWLQSDGFETLCAAGYTRLSECPEVEMAVDYIAGLIGSMTIHLMRNTDKGDVRVVDGLAKKVDINPCGTMGRQTWLSYIVKNMLIEGNQIVLPRTKDGYIEELLPIAPSRVSYLPDGESYLVQISGRVYRPEDVLHFKVNPDPERCWYGSGYRLPLRDILKNLKQAAKTQNGFMSSQWKPSIIVKVDGLVDEFSSPEGRQKLLDEYLSTGQAGEPWMIPAEQFEVQQVKPLSLNDLAINDSVTLDKRSVAAIFGVPPHVVGVGEFNKEEHRAFISTRIQPLAQIIEQELTGKLLYSPDLYFRLNPWKIRAYDVPELARIGQELYVRGIVTGNEVRDWVSLPPKDGLDERVILENYIPAGMIGDQKKLIQGGET